MSLNRRYISIYYLPLGLLLGESELYALTPGMQDWYPHRLCAVLFIQSGLHGCAGLQRLKHQARRVLNSQEALKKDLITICFL